ncbi:site-specific DNA-methyltransferase [Salinibacter ruber]|uniref:site-specific DNA-methyltransferase n=1 Tax=Salinibacter ruber TaxID=146919 RepID=UPI00216A4283|nr:site-specific DNA-methyltransferase [Salinibacter ruber]MCS4057166.1 adenine-specific DNA-methyltransferase [Salinibacter ruber]MCS4059946.1 adenine-specific DNA-methyltransferase [Salinibacter ruber]MCS4161561.1 adenine-specific DNA-methyltransferase [Salinibacter ruber]
MTTSDSLQDFQDLLRDLFQFDVADLDFGVYRILNEKRDDIERFIEEDLVEGVRKELRAYEEGKMEARRKELDEAAEKVRENVSPDAIVNGSIAQKYLDLDDDVRPQAIDDYLEAKEQLEEVSLAKETERHIYDDLARFFNRYYDSGDFVTKRRFAAGDSKYYVPYDGEEVLLHWANRDQYYVKTTEHFRDYRFSVRDVDVHFQLVDAQVPQDNVKASDTRYFVLQGADPVEVDADAKTCTIRFAYRPITEEEDERLLERYNEGKSNQRKTNDRSTIVEATTEQILDAIDDATVRTNLGQSEEEENSPLRKHLNRYTAKHTADYFVHKDLGGFLRGQLGFFIQNEVLQLDDVLEASEQRRAHQVDRAKVVKKIGERIIDFLAQIENFQKRLFEKKKFVVDTGYCVTLDRVPDALYDDILDNDDQLNEWRDLYSVEEWDNGLFSQGYEDGAFTRDFLKAHPHVMIDTRHFDHPFVDTLLDHLSDLDDEDLSEVVDGLCIQGENFQALNLLRERFKEKVDCVYIDPPYNTGNDGFLYKDTYRHSSWMSMMADRLSLTRSLMPEESVVFISNDDYESNRLRTLLDSIFGELNFIANAIWQKVYAPKNSAKHFSDDHEYLLTYANNAEKWRPNLLPRSEKALEKYGNRDDDPRGKWRPDNLLARNPYSKGEYEVESPSGKTFENPVGTYWRVSKKKFKELDEDNRIWWGENGDNMPALKRFLSEVKDGVVPQTLWTYDEVGHTQKAKRELMEAVTFERTEDVLNTVKPTKLIERVLQIGTDSNSGSRILDYFAGSGTTGHAVINQNRVDGGNRKYTLVEMGEYFDSILLPRLKRIVLSSEWDDDQPESEDGVTHVIRYHRLESYEDALNNIKVEKPDTELDLMDRFDDYALHYMLPTETRESETLLAPEAFEKPFDYTLRIQHGMESPTAHEVDLESTFNYLIGLEVETRRVYEHQGRRYVVVTGQVEREQSIEEVMVVWRDRGDLDLGEEKEWAADTLPDGPFDTVYVNGPSHIHGKAEPTEIVFRERMDPAAG